MKIEFGARLIKTAAATSLAVIGSTWLFGDSNAAIFAGLAAFAAVTPNLQLSWQKAGHTLLANLLGGFWAVLVVTVLPATPLARLLEILLAIFAGLFLGHHLLPGQEGPTLTAILALLGKVPEVGQQTAFLQRLGIVFLGSLAGLAINALYPPGHLIAARNSIQQSLAPLRSFADRVIFSLDHPDTFAKEEVKSYREDVQAHLNEAVRRLSYVDSSDMQRRELRWRVQTLHILLDSLAELHRWALYHGGIDEPDRSRLAETIKAMLQVLSTPAQEFVKGDEPAWTTLEHTEQHDLDKVAFYPLQHILFRLLLVRQQPNTPLGGTRRDT